jgi:hypothetical protein
MIMLQNIRMTTKTFSRTDSGKSWRTNPDQEEAKTIDETQYNNIVSDDAQKWFRRLGGSETATRSYTRWGYKVTQLSSCSPDRSIKKVRTFDLENATREF